MYLNRELRQQTASRSKRLSEETLAEGSIEQTATGVITLRVDFVCKPGGEREIAGEVGDLLAEAGLHQKGLTASMLLVSDREARLAIIGLAPGLRGANRTGRPFTGDFAGGLLYDTLAQYGFARGRYAPWRGRSRRFRWHYWGRWPAIFAR